jgi:hypothetical protein
MVSVPRWAIRVGLATIVIAVPINPTRASPDGDAMTKFGLTGHWAVACQAAPGPKNPHEFFVGPPLGSPIARIVGGEPGQSGIFPLIDIQIISAEKIAYTAVDVQGTRYNIVVARNGMRLRTMDINTGGQVVANQGVTTATGAETFWLERCPD